MHWNVWSDGKATFKKQLSVPEAMIVSLAAMLVLFLALFSMGELSWFHYLPISHRSFGSMLQLSLSCFVARPSALEAMLRNMVWSWPVAAEAFNVRRATFLRLHSTCFSAASVYFKLTKRRFLLWEPWPAWSCRTMAHHAAACANLQDLTSHRPVARRRPDLSGAAKTSWNCRNCHDTSAGSSFRPLECLEQAY